MEQAPLEARQHMLRGHEVVSHTASFNDGRHCCFVFLFDPRDGGDLKVFKAYGSGVDEAENLALSQALSFLQFHDIDVAATVTSHSSIDIAGRKVDIFCDLVTEGRYQAFPFVRRADGSRALIMQFHLKEAVTGDSPAAALDRCISRLEDYFSSGAIPESATPEKPASEKASQGGLKTRRDA
ncbi:MAG TPA: hypothetical protein VFE84_12485 [Patescibacteria group bacterium]|nr:hypothetical protein [Patescibacteria group bacterium]